MKYAGVIHAWNAQADCANQWAALGEDEKIEYAMKIEREECAKACEQYDDDGGVGEAWACRFAEHVRVRSNVELSRRPDAAERTEK